LISILAVNPDLLNIASISFIILFTEGHLKNRCCIVSSLSLIWQRWHLPLNINDKLQFLNESNTTISPDKLKIKVIQGIFKQNINQNVRLSGKNSMGVILIGHKFGQN
jgi:hypothetical protein